MNQKDQSSFLSRVRRSLFPPPGPPPIPPCYLDGTKYDQIKCNEYDDCMWNEEEERCRIKQGTLNDLDRYECRMDIFPEQCSERFGRDYACIHNRCQRFTGMFFVPFTDAVMYGETAEMEMKGDEGIYGKYGWDSPIFYMLRELGWNVVGADSVYVPDVGYVDFAHIKGPYRTRKDVRRAIKLYAERLGVEAVMAKDRIEGEFDPYQLNRSAAFEKKVLNSFHRQSR